MGLGTGGCQDFLPCWWPVTSGELAVESCWEGIGNNARVLAADAHAADAHAAATQAGPASLGQTATAHILGVPWGATGGLPAIVCTTLVWMGLRGVALSARWRCSMCSWLSDTMPCGPITCCGPLLAGGMHAAWTTSPNRLGGGAIVAV